MGVQRPTNAAPPIFEPKKAMDCLQPPTFFQDAAFVGKAVGPAIHNVASSDACCKRCSAHRDCEYVLSFCRARAILLFAIACFIGTGHTTAVRAR
jgi:hypothetical protein